MIKPERNKWIFTGTIEHWTDGDTLIVSVDLGFRIKHKIRVRLARINSWELNSKSSYRRRYAKHARAIAKKFFPISSGVTITTKKHDRYGRWIGEAYSRGLNISDTLLESKEKGFELYQL